MDCYNFGSPAIGDSNFAIAVESNLNKPFNRYSVIWRFILDADFATRLPFAGDDINVISNLDINSLHNYVHVGVPIRLYWDGIEPMVSSQFYSTGIKVEMYTYLGEKKQKMTLRKDQWRFRRGLIHMVKSLFPLIYTGKYDINKSVPVTSWLGRLVIPKTFVDHFPHRYYESLEKAKKHILGQGLREIGHALTLKSVADGVVKDSMDGVVVKNVL